MAAPERLGDVLERERANAALAWVLVAFVALVSVANLLDGDLLWAGFAAALAGLALVPTLAYRRPRVMLPWEVLALAALPLIGRAFTTTWLTGTFVTYLAVAAFALVIAVELHIFTPVSMTPGFAVVFVVVATMATAGIWAIARWAVDIAFGTAFLLEHRVDPALSEHEVETRLMWEFVYSTAAGLVGGVVFEWYFRRRARLDERLPESEVTEA